MLRFLFLFSPYFFLSKVLAPRSVRGGGDVNRTRKGGAEKEVEGEREGDMERDSVTERKMRWSVTERKSTIDSD